MTTMIKLRCIDGEVSNEDLALGKIYTIPLDEWKDKSTLLGFQFGEERRLYCKGRFIVVEEKFLNKDNKPFKDLTPEQKLIIIEAMENNTYEVYSHVTHTYYTPNSDSSILFNKIYREKLLTTPLSIPWDAIHDDWKYAAMDEGEHVYFFEHEPTYNALDQGWARILDSPDKSNCTHAGAALKIDTTGIIPELSLAKRN